MAGLFGGGAKTTPPTRYSSIQVQSSVSGTPIPMGWGTFRVAANLLWYGDFKSKAIKQKTGGKGGGSQTTGYNYSASVVLGICAGPITSIRAVYKDQTALASVSAAGLSLFTGALGQTPWTYLSSNFASQAIGYSGIAYVAASNYALSTSATLPNHSFEVVSTTIVAGKDDANPKDILTSFLGSVPYWQAAWLADVTNYGNYCLAAGLLLSPVIDSQRTAADFISEILQASNSDCCWSEGLLKITPLGDTQITGNSVTWTPNLTPVYSLDNTILMGKSEGEDPVLVAINKDDDAWNYIQVEYLDRANQYNTQIMPGVDPASIDQWGKRVNTSPYSLHSICDRGVATNVASLLVQRTSNTRRTFTFCLPWNYCLLDPMDLVTITSGDLQNILVRINEITEGADGLLEITAEEMLVGSGTAPLINRQVPGGYQSNFEADPGKVNSPVMVNPPRSLTGGEYELWIGTSGGANWGGCEVWASYDNTTYSPVGVIDAPARYGTTTSALAVGTDPDSTNSVGVDLTISNGALAGATSAAADNHVTLALVGSEVIAYSAATLTATNKYTLGTYMRRGLNGTTIANQPIGSTFLRLDATVFAFPFRADQVGKTVYLKFRSFNSFGQAYQDISICDVYTVVLTASAATFSTVAWTDISARPANLAALTGTEPIKNALIGVNGSGVLTSDGTTPVTGSPVVANSQISITAGALNGIGTGAGTVVANSSITVTAGQLNGIGTGTGAYVDNSQITIAGGKLVRYTGDTALTNYIDNGQIGISGGKLVRYSGDTALTQTIDNSLVTFGGLTDRPTTLSALDGAAGSKLGGIAPNAGTPFTLYDPTPGNFTIVGNSVTQAIGTGGAYVPVYSKEAQVGTAQMSATLDTYPTVFGIATARSGTGYSMVNAGFYRDGTGALFTVEGGAAVTSIGTLAAYPATVSLLVLYNGYQYLWYVDGVLKRSLAAASGLTHFAAALSVNAGGQISHMLFGAYSNNAWSAIGGAGKAADNATVGADWATNITGRPANVAALAGGEPINNNVIGFSGGRLIRYAGDTGLTNYADNSYVGVYSGRFSNDGGATLGTRVDNNHVVVTAAGDLSVDNGVTPLARVDNSKQTWAPIAGTTGAPETRATRNVPERALNRNSAFQDGLSGFDNAWAGSPPTVSANAASVRGGSVVSLTAGAGVRSEMIPCTPGETLYFAYRFATTANRTNASAPTWIVEAGWGSTVATPATIDGNVPYNGAAFSVANGVQSGVAVLTVPAGAYGVEVLAGIDLGAGATGATGYVDYLELHRDEPGANVTENRPIVSRLNATTGIANDASVLPANSRLANIGTLKDAVTISDTDNTGTVTINIGAAVYYPDAGSTITFPSGSVAGAAYNTTYFIKRTGVDASSAPTGTAWNISTTLTIGVGEVYVNRYTTRANGTTPSPPPPPPPGGGAACVAADAFVETRSGGFVRAKDIVAGDWLRVLTEDREGTEWEECEGNEVAESEMVRITTAQGIALSLSVSTPLTLRDGTIAWAPEAARYELPCFTGRLSWQACSVEPLGTGQVAHIHCHGRTYAAGDAVGRSILTHNPIKP